MTSGLMVADPHCPGSANCILCHEHCTLCGPHCIFCTEHCTLFSANCILCPEQCTLCSAHCIVCPEHCTLCSANRKCCSDLGHSKWLRSSKLHQWLKSYCHLLNGWILPIGGFSWERLVLKKCVKIFTQVFNK